MAQSKPVVLFVDDEPNILHGLRRSLRGLREEWDMLFVNGGVPALQILRGQKVDALVCDLRMPEVDGAEVIQEAMRCQPEAVRIILSGHADEKLFFRALGPAHQSFMKPCDTDSLVQGLQRAFSVRALLPTETLRHFTSDLAVLPTPSESFRRLMEQLDSPLSSAMSIGREIEADVSLTAQLLRIANSAFFALPRTVSTARSAVEMLGIETVRALLTVAQFYLVDDVAGGTAEQVRGLADRSLLISAVARQIALSEQLPAARVEDAAAAGLLAHVGSAVLMLNCPDRYERMTQEMDSANLPLHDVERDRFGITHAELSAYLLGIWGFSDLVVLSAALHHAPLAPAAPLPGQGERQVLACVHAAQVVAGEVFGAARFKRQKDQGLDLAFLQGLGWADHVDTWRQICRDSLST